MIEVDGSYLEGGGQILRTALSLSAIIKEPCRVFNIRKKRKKTGLRTQHLLGARALAELCKGRLEGDFLYSEEIKFYPEQDYKERVSVNIPTAGSITLVLQTLIPPSLFSKKPIEITFNGGATDTFFSPTIDHFRYCLLEILKEMGIKIEINILKRGYYPEGGAEVKAVIHPGKPKALNLSKRGQLKEILIFSGASNFLKEKKVAERQIFGVREILGKLKLPLKEKVEYYSTECPGSQICLVTKFTNTAIGTDNLGKLGKRAEDVGKEAALELLNEQKSGACLDKYLTDQLLPYLALNKKGSVTVPEITSHCKTNMWVIEKFLGGKFKTKDNLIVWSL